MDNKDTIKSIFEYMRAVKKLDDKIIRTVDDYGSKGGEDKFFIGNIISNLDDGERGFIFNRSEEKEVWIDIYKQTLEESPLCKRRIREYVRNSNIDNPLEEILFTASIEEFEEEDEYESILLEYREWKSEWDKWSERNSGKYTIQELYKKLFKLYQFISINGEEFELVYCDSLLAWNKDGNLIKHPLLTKSMELKFDAKFGKFSLIPTDEYSSLEIDVFDGLSIPNMDKILDIKNTLKNEMIEYRTIADAKERLEEIINLITYSKSALSIVEKVTDLKNINATDEPIIYNVPMLLFRKKNVKHSIQDLEEIMKNIEEGKEIPKTIKALVMDNGELNSELDIDSTEWKEVGEDILFPLQANDDQKEIARRIASNYGMVVQGPPGTGKSHTIVNLISHLLAHGKRILVTSQTEKALSVLREKIPEGIRNLCISVLGSDRNSMKSLDESVRVITDNLALEPERLLKEIKEIEKNLHENRKRSSEIKNLLKDIEEKSNVKLRYEEEEYNLIEASKWIKENENTYDFLQDKLRLEDEILLTNNEFSKYITLINSISEEDLKKISQVVKVQNEIPKCDSLVNDIKRIEELKALEISYKEKLNDFEYNEEILENVNHLKDKLSRIKNKLEEINKNELAQLLYKHQEDSFIRDITQTFLNKANENLKVIENNLKELLLKNIVIPTNVEFEKFKKDYEIVSKELENQETLGLMFKLKNRKSLYVLDICKVDNKDMSNSEARKIISLNIKNRELIEEFIVLYNNYAGNYGIEKISEITPNNITTLQEKLNLLNEVNSYETKYIQEIVSLFNGSIPKKLDLYSTESINVIIDKISDKINSIKVTTELQNLNIKIDEYKDIFISSGINSNMINDIESYNYEDIYKFYDNIDRLASLSGTAQEINILSEKMNKYFPLLNQEIVNRSFNDINFNIEEAAKFIKWNNYLDYIDKANTESLEEELKLNKTNEKYMVLQLVNKKTWYNQISNISDKSKRSLYAWLEAMKKIGKGTGKMANHYRKTAKREMANCKQAIPVWIMPFNKVIESLSISEDLFDVVIFDESSQSNIFALQALFRAKKAVIVGDDKQISPIAVGYNKEEQFKLIDLYLKNVPNREWFDLETSLYNTALRIFPNKLMLKEHFRCVPEIIQFSNNFSYSGQIVPLRYPNAHEKFEDPVVAVKVVDGYRSESTRKENIPEAEAIVKKIVECCSNRKYDGMTMGVISLLGSDQAGLIEDMLREKLGEREMINRKIVCGDSYSFQGDERDIIFLSMVVANNKRFAALTKEDNKKRFNVAASRAKNQMWLFHSVDLKDLNPECSRYALLSYCSNPTKIVRETAENRFDSKFEEDVYKLIRAKGYVVNTQVQAGRYRIDLVVEGIKNRLAIECDGDKWHGIDKWEEDMERQVQLERVGWIFVRIRGSKFYRNPESAMEPVWNKIKELRIEKENEVEVDYELIDESITNEIIDDEEKNIIISNEVDDLMETMDKDVDLSEAEFYEEGTGDAEFKSEINELEDTISLKKYEANSDVTEFDDEKKKYKNLSAFEKKKERMITAKEDYFYLLTDGQKQVAEFLVENFEKIVECDTQAQLAQLANVSTSLITSTFRRLKLVSYKDFKIRLNIALGQEFNPKRNVAKLELSEDESEVNNKERQEREKINEKYNCILDLYKSEFYNVCKKELVKLFEFSNELIDEMEKNQKYTILFICCSFGEIDAALRKFDFESLCMTRLKDYESNFLIKIKNGDIGNLEEYISKRRNFYNFQDKNTVNLILKNIINYYNGSFSVR